MTKIRLTCNTLTNKFCIKVKGHERIHTGLDENSLKKFYEKGHDTKTVWPIKWQEIVGRIELTSGSSWGTMDEDQNK